MRAAVLRVACVAPQELVALGESGWETLRGGRVVGPDLRPWLKRRKDKKLLPRAAQLVLPAAGEALGQVDQDPEEIGVFVGIRREPPDTGEADAAIGASLRDGALDGPSLAGRGRDLYPPLLPLKTLPNMVLAHISINLGLRGPSDTRAGGPCAGVNALRMGIHAVAEGRCPLALVAAADSWVDAGSLRDHARLGRSEPPGEAAVALLLAPAGHPEALYHLQDGGAGTGTPPASWPHWSRIGRCGTADPLVALVMDGAERVRGVDDHGAWAEVTRGP